MRLSSSPSDDSGGEGQSGRLFGPLFADPGVERELSDAAMLGAMLEVESTLASVQADLGIIPVDAAEAIAKACRAGAFDVGEIGRQADASGNPVVPLVKAIGAQLPADAAGWLHRGATSQDVLDTALMLTARRAVRVLRAHLRVGADVAFELSTAHRDSVMVARTLGQQAAPTTFGLKAAGWLVALDAAEAGLATADDALAVQFGGAVGNLGALGEPGLAVLAGLATALGLAEPTLPWHTDRGRVLGLAAALGSACAALGKIGLDVVLLAQSEVGEVSEGAGGGEGLADSAGSAGRGGSSAMPHKHNPVDAILVRSAAMRAPGLVSTLLLTSQQEHERGAGGWHGEWLPLRELLSVTGGAASRTRRMLAGMEVHADRMRANLEATGGRLMAEHAAAALAPALGRAAAHDVVARCLARGGNLRDVLLADDEVRAHLEPEQLDDLLAPRRALAAVGPLIDRALAAHRALPDAGS
jgi:3-carboxy-cis,cis-muconate cycloisomerase